MFMNVIFRIILKKGISFARMEKLYDSNKHAQSSVAKWGGSPEDYIELHDWFDETKMFTGDWTHRALRHHSAGIQWAIQKFGHAIQISTGHAIPTKLIAEQHITEDCGFIPTPAHYLSPLAGLGLLSKNFPLFDFGHDRRDDRRVCRRPNRCRPSSIEHRIK